MITLTHKFEVDVFFWPCIGCICAGIYKWGSFGKQPCKWTISETLPILKEKVNFVSQTVHIYFSLQVDMNGKPSVFEARSEIPKIQEAYHSFSKNT